MSKLNNIYEQLDSRPSTTMWYRSAIFSIIDEAHYMLSFDNRPPGNLIAVGRNKGLSIILATQNMADFKTKGFDFSPTRSTPWIMRQQTDRRQGHQRPFGVGGAEPRKFAPQ